MNSAFFRVICVVFALVFAGCASTASPYGDSKEWAEKGMNPDYGNTPLGAVKGDNCHPNRGWVKSVQLFAAGNVVKVNLRDEVQAGNVIAWGMNNDRPRGLLTKIAPSIFDLTTNGGDPSEIFSIQLFVINGRFGDRDEAFEKGVVSRENFYLVNGKCLNESEFDSYQKDELFAALVKGQPRFSPEVHLKD